MSKHTHGWLVIAAALVCFVIAMLSPVFAGMLDWEGPERWDMDGWLYVLISSVGVCAVGEIPFAHWCVCIGTSLVPFLMLLAPVAHWHRTKIGHVGRGLVLVLCCLATVCLLIQAFARFGAYDKRTALLWGYYLLLCSVGILTAVAYSDVRSAVTGKRTMANNTIEETSR